MKKIRENFIYFMLVLFPIIDVLSSFNIRYNILPVSLGVILRGIVLLYIIIYLLFNKEIDELSKKKYIKYFIILALFFTIFISLRLISKISLNSLLKEIIAFSKFWYFPITLIFANNYDFDNKKLSLSLKISTILYSLGILIPLFTNTAFSSYIDEYEGIIGWFYSANEIGGLLAINLILLYLNIKNKNNKIYTLLIILNVFCLSLIGTKVSLFSIILVTLIVLILFGIKKGIKSNEVKTAFTIIIISSMIVLCNNTSYDIVERLNINLPFMTSHKKTKKSELLSGRDILLKNAYAEYKITNIPNKLFGMGYMVEDKYRAVEMDMFDILFGFGIIGFIVYFIPLGYYGLEFIRKRRNFTLHNMVCLLGVGMLLSIAFLAGHTLSAPAVSLYISISLGLTKKSSLEKIE